MRHKMHGLWGGESCAVQAIDSLHRPEHRRRYKQRQSMICRLFQRSTSTIYTALFGKLGPKTNTIVLQMSINLHQTIIRMNRKYNVTFYFETFLVFYQNRWLDCHINKIRKLNYLFFLMQSINQSNYYWHLELISYSNEV